jgi:hypothetical protein
MGSLDPAASAKRLHDLRLAMVRDERHGFFANVPGLARVANPLGSAVYDRRLPDEPLEVCASWAISRVKSQDTKTKTPNRWGITLGFTPKPLSGGNLFETEAQRDVRIFHIIANFAPLKRRTRWIGEVPPSAPKPFFQRAHILFQSVGHK